MKYLMGLDNGGTSVKAVIFDLKGNEVAQASSQIKTVMPQSFFVERSMEDVLAKNYSVINDAVRMANIDPSDILALGLSGHGKGIYLVGKNDEYVYNSILSSDSRAEDIVEKWKNEGKDRLFHANFQNPSASQVPALMKWFQINSSVLEKTKHIFGIKDFIAYKLTGVACNEITDLSSSGLVDFQSRTLDVDVLENLGLGEYSSLFSPIIHSTTVVGGIRQELKGVLSLPTGCPVVAGMFDVDACALAMNIIDDDYLSITGGTWSINAFISKKIRFENTTTQHSIYCLDDYYFIEESSPTSASNNEWFIQTFLPSLSENTDLNQYEYVNRIVEESEITLDGPIYCPYLYGANYEKRAKAGLIGLNSSNTLGDVFRAIYEGVVFSHKRHIDALLRSKGVFKAYRLAGGVVNSEIWVQMFADILNQKIETVKQKELGALGAALAAGVGAGIYPSLAEASAETVKVDKTFYPYKKNVEIYKKKFQRYQDLSDFLISSK